ncbi:kinase-like protein [Neohortaea acidophila]|uniref:EKC/KEOPS complex subunit BUD32 n=1 Tax=Neohortaea acidophila TaxID=245834 RepID=A0A6A6PWM6_9PEZI|nr:kinase-like protein [Neohortaea acidophila]KAF2484079.1 kinase-like protein [Neohortaea acidophila]
MSPDSGTPYLPAPFTTSPTPLTLITRGAEAALYKTTFLTPHQPCALKIRPPKPWRHPTLDARLTRQRILAEARALVKCGREGVRVPQVLGMSWEEGWVALEWIAGRTVKDVIWGWRAEGAEKGDAWLRGLLGKVGRAVGLLHSIGVVHGDLTSSNMIVEEQGSTAGEGEIVLIDFGLATQAVQEEDRAVDLYVLERAFGSTHPREEALFGVVLEAYAGSYKGAKATLKRLEDVRMRGRKKSMIG